MSDDIRVSGIPRRDFLIQTSAALVGVGVAAAVGDGALDAAAAAPLPKTPPLSVAFWEGRPGVSASEQVCALVPGEAVCADEHFTSAREVRVTVHGLWRAADCTGPCSVHLVPRYPIPGSASRVNVFAWHYLDQGRGRVSGSPRTFTMPVGADGTVELAIRHHTTQGAAHTHASDGPLELSAFGDVLAFRIDDVPSALTLRRGTYAIAIGARPDWSAVALVDRAGVLASDAGPLAAGPRAARVDFDYLLLSIA